MRNRGDVVILLSAIFGVCTCGTPYYGSKIGSFKTHVHGVVGDLFVVDHKTIFIKDFSYDGEGPDAFFWAGSTQRPDSTGFIIPDENGGKEPLKAYSNKNILIRLPSEKTLKDIKWLSVWCRKFSANFAEVFIPRDLQIPHPVEIGRIPTLEHGVSSKSVMIIDAQTLLVPDFKYDGEGPAAYWWTSRGARQHPRGLKLADENGSFSPLPMYTGKTVVISFPDSKTIYDYDWFGVYCEEAQVDFGSVRLPQHILVPPSPKMLGVELEYKLNCEILYDDLGFEIRWIMDREDVVIQLAAKIKSGEYMSFGFSKNDTKSEMINSDVTVTWIGKDQKGHAVDYFLGSKEQCSGRRGSCPDTKQPDGQNSVTLLNAANVNGYTMVTFKRPQVGGDKYDQHVYSDGPQAVVWAIGPLNKRDEVSYHSLRSQGDVLVDFARPPQWNCPQPAEETTTPRPRQATTTAKPVSAKPLTSVRSKKPKPNILASDKRKKIIYSGTRSGTYGQAPDSRTSASNVDSVWHIPSITCPSESTFRAQIGPAGGGKGYQAKTGHVGWGIAWYINGLLIPEITVQRGKTYTFIVEGGNDPGNPARSHPFYITDDPEGGFDNKILPEKRRTRIFAGVIRDRFGSYVPTAVRSSLTFYTTIRYGLSVSLAEAMRSASETDKPYRIVVQNVSEDLTGSSTGRMCEWRLPKQTKLTPDDFETFSEFQERLELTCEAGKESKLRWRPDKNTPDVVYYQCYNHRYLGWKIHVVDSCEDVLDREAEASIRHEKNVTFNSFPLNTSVSDYRRGLTAEKKTNLEGDGRSFFPEFKNNDGIPLVLTEADAKSDAETKGSVEDINPKIQEDTTKNKFQKDGGIRSINPRPLKTHGDGWTGIAVNVTTHAPRQQVNIYPSSTYAPRQQVNIYPSSTYIPRQQVNRYTSSTYTPRLTTPIPRQQVNIEKSFSRKITPWWKPIAQPPRPELPVNRHKAIQTLKTQLAIIRNTKENPANVPLISAASSAGSQTEKRLVPLVIKESRPPEKSLKRVPVIIRKVTKNVATGNIKNMRTFNPHHLNISSGVRKVWKQPSVPVFIRSGVAHNVAPIRRTTGQSTRNFVDIALSNMPFSQPSMRKKTPSTSKSNSDNLFFPVFITSAPKFNRTFIKKESHPTPKSPLVPVIISENPGNEEDFIYRILPLIKHQLEKQGMRL